MSTENILSGMMEPPSEEMEEALNELNMKGDELRRAAEKSGMALAGTNRELGFDESMMEDDDDDDEEGDEEDSEDEWSGMLPPTVEAPTAPPQSFATPSHTSPQMTKEVMSASISSMQKTLRSLKISSPPQRTNKERVDDWAGSTKQKLGKAATDMLITALDTHPSADDNTLPWILCGWNMRGDHNVVEVRNVHQAIQELINSGIAQQTGFKKEASGIITGFKECQKDIQTLVHGMKDALASKQAPIAVPLGRDIPEPKLSQIVISTPKPLQKDKGKHVPLRDVEKDKRMLLKKLAKKPEDMIKFCSPEGLSQILHDIVVSMASEDWESLETMGGKMAMSKVLADEINRRTNH